MDFAETAACNAFDHHRSQLKELPHRIAMNVRDDTLRGLDVNIPGVARLVHRA